MTILPVLSMKPSFPCCTTRKSGPTSPVPDAAPASELHRTASRTAHNSDTTRLRMPASFAAPADSAHPRPAARIIARLSAGNVSES